MLCCCACCVGVCINALCHVMLCVIATLKRTAIRCDHKVESKATLVLFAVHEEIVYSVRIQDTPMEGEEGPIHLGKCIHVSEIKHDETKKKGENKKKKRKKEKNENKRSKMKKTKKKGLPPQLIFISQEFLARQHNVDTQELFCHRFCNSVASFLSLRHSLRPFITFNFCSECEYP